VHLPILPATRGDPQRRLDLGRVENVPAFDDHGNLVNILDMRSWIAVLNAFSK
jgi:hypothetical protein